jgi:hypothetical protein
MPSTTSKSVIVISLTLVNFVETLAAIKLCCLSEYRDIQPSHAQLISGKVINCLRINRYPGERLLELLT